MSEFQDSEEKCLQEFYLSSSYSSSSLFVYLSLQGRVDELFENRPLLLNQCNASSHTVVTTRQFFVKNQFNVLSQGLYLPVVVPKHR